MTHTFLIFEQLHIFLTVSSNQDFVVEQFFRADDFWADDPSPSRLENITESNEIVKEIISKPSGRGQQYRREVCPCKPESSKRDYR